jgi:hypothetical protein
MRIADEVSDACMDSIGRRTIVYWRGVPYDGPDED